MTLVKQCAVGVLFGFACTAISDTFISGVIAGSLVTWINFGIGGLLKSDEETAV